jgi:hypothetical protein
MSRETISRGRSGSHASHKAATVKIEAALRFTHEGTIETKGLLQIIAESPEHVRPVLPLTDYFP